MANVVTLALCCAIAAKLLPRVPVLVAKCDIAPGDEVFVSYNTEKPLAEGALVAEGGAGQGTVECGKRVLVCRVT